MTIPNSKTGTSWAINPLSTATHTFAVWYDLAGELHVGRIHRGSQRWGVSHQEYTVAGAPRTALALPVQDDDHAAPSMAVDGTGHLHVWANMHNNPLRGIKTVDPHMSDTWLNTTGWADASTDLPSVDVQCTYPVAAHFPDGSLWFYLRDGPVGGLSGQYDSSYWTRTPSGSTWSARTKLWQGLSVPDAGGSGIPGAGAGSPETEVTNWSVYPSNFYVESPRDPHAGRMHAYWIWRVRGLDGRSNVMPSYGYSDDGGVTWKAIDGTTLTVPIHPLNSVAARMPLGSAFIRNIARSSNIVVAEVDTPNHGFQVGDSIFVYCQDTSYDGQFTVGNILTDPPRIAWGQVAADDPAGGTGSVCKENYFNGAAICVDPQGLPHILASTNPAFYIRRNDTNTGWLQTQLANPLSGHVHNTIWGGAFWLRGHLWGLVLTHPSFAPRVRLIRITGATPGPVVTLSGDVGGTAWDPGFDPEAWRLHGTVETLAPDGDRPRVFTFGSHTRRQAA